MATIFLFILRLFIGVTGLGALATWCCVAFVISILPAILIAKLAGTSGGEIIGIIVAVWCLSAYLSSKWKWLDRMIVVFRLGIEAILEGLNKAIEVVNLKSDIKSDL